MRSKFISTLLEILEEFPVIAAGFVIRESWEDKIIRSGGMDPKRIRQNFYNLKYRKIIRDHPKGFALTSKGQRWFLDLKFRQLKIRSRKWDNQWRIIIFDIPEQFKNARQVLRNKLKALDFKMIQKSVFVCPFHCENEISFLVRYLDIESYVDLVQAFSIGSKEKEFKQYYNL
ncbi:MAG: hypothetical protein Q7S32_03150 [bacterium]|nr:hypothetical protein [bacterium]